MDKEIKEKLNKLLDTMLDKVAEKMEEMEGALDKALQQPCKIHIYSNGNDTQLDVEGGRLTLLLTLAGAEQSILKQLKCSEDEFNFIKNIVGTREAGDNE